ncbi:MAG: hypothetical protein AAF346_05305 [Pseudomonadota bacterium]
MSVKSCAGARRSLKETQHMLSKVSAAVWIIGLATILGSAPAMSDDKKYAAQLQLKNCGAYQLWKVSLQRRAAGSSQWHEITNKQTNVLNGYAICFDVSQWPQFVKGDSARLRGFIDVGDTEVCDSTNFDGPVTNGKTGQRRNFRMEGTTKNNNGCRSHGYKKLMAGSNCGKNGTKLHLGC